MKTRNVTLTNEPLGHIGALKLVHQLDDLERAFVSRAIEQLPSRAELQRREQERELKRQLRQHITARARAR